MLKHGILGLLNYGDMSGYEIMQVFHNSLNYFWSAQTSQIYRELYNLEEKGWIRKTEQKHPGKPDRYICSITKEGRNELKRWLALQGTCSDIRSPLLMKVFFMGELTPSQGIAFFEQIKKEYSHSLETLDQAQASADFYKQSVPDPNRVMYWQMTSDFGKRYAQMMIDWSNSCIEKIQEQASGKENL